MLSAIKDVLFGFVDMVTSLVDFVIGLVKDIVYVVKLTASFVLKIPKLFGWLPGSVVALIVTLFAVVVIYKVLGREG